MIKFLKALLFFIIVLFAFSLGVKYSYLFTKADLNILTEADITFSDEDNTPQQIEQKIVIEDIPTETKPLTEAEQNEIDTLNNTMPDFNGMNEEVGNELNGTVNPAPMNNGENYLDNVNNNSANPTQQVNNNTVQNNNVAPQQPTTTNQVQQQNVNNNMQQPTINNNVQQPTINNNVQQPTINNNVQQPTTINQAQPQNANNNTQKQIVNTNNNVKVQ